MNAGRLPLAASIVSVADHAGNHIAAGHARRLYQAADCLDALYDACDLVLGRIEAGAPVAHDEAEVLREVLANARGESA